MITWLLTQPETPAELLPYTPVEYLRSPSAQYIDTGIYPDDSTGLLTCYCASSRNGQFNYPGGAMYNDGSARFYGPGVTANMGNASFGWNISKALISGGINPLVKSVTRLNFLNDRVASFDNGEISASLPLLEMLIPVNNTIHLFGVNRDGSNVTNYDMRIYYAVISKGETIVRHFVPALDADGTPCMWDKISKAFFYNIGTGSFLVP